MDRDQIIRLAREAGAGIHFDGVAIFSAAGLGRFWSLARASALEEAAQMFERREAHRKFFSEMLYPGQCAAAIRSLASEGESNG